MNKSHLIHTIKKMLEKRFETAATAAHQAYEAATDKESVAENKYDTFGLEASYLAHGQSQRVIECENDLKHFLSMTFKDFNEDDAIAMGALVELEESAGKQITCFISPCAGGQAFDFEGKNCLLITPSSPLGRALLGANLEDEVKVTIGADTKFYEITHLS
ncbi:hypothetical protein MED121_13945 [Marinomonas sp. MED121]|uniref:GreA/GreB family elongation factor n=1 Tax=Marinomonas sp. MED121 TaxID=314277 RepID=UPI000068FF8B|nr:GreA/GreB family elongation factor [Marinomonas sp. MED121]EAQ67035.1 hypothetical protein MED121_13945 [Marinomonas sp. MED121]